MKTCLLLAHMFALVHTSCLDDESCRRTETCHVSGMTERGQIECNLPGIPTACCDALGMFFECDGRGDVPGDMNDCIVRRRSEMPHFEIQWIFSGEQYCTGAGMPDFGSLLRSNGYEHCHFADPAVIRISGISGDSFKESLNGEYSLSGSIFNSPMWTGHSSQGDVLLLKDGSHRWMLTDWSDIQTAYVKAATCGDEPSPTDVSVWEETRPGGRWEASASILVVGISNTEVSVEDITLAVVSGQFTIMTSQQPKPEDQTSLLPGVLGFVMGAAVVTSVIVMNKKRTSSELREPLTEATA